MGDPENVFPASKKRAAGREISKDNPGLDDEEDSAEQETGTFKRASDEVLATRRIVKVRRNQSTSASANPFAGICLVPPTDLAIASTAVTTDIVSKSEKISEDCIINVSKETEKDGDENVERLRSKTAEPVAELATVKPSTEGEEIRNEVNVTTESRLIDDEAVENSKIEDKKAAGDGKVESEVNRVGGKEKDLHVEGSPASLNSFQQLCNSQNAFTGLAGTGISTSMFTFGSLSKDGPVLGAGACSFFGRIDQPSFGLGSSNNGSSSLFNMTGSSAGSKGEGTGFVSMQEITVETGEENERVIFSADSVLFEFLDGSWKERGKGELKVNLSTLGTERARLLMRARGNYRLILNASLYPDMKLTNMDKRGVTFPCVNSAGEAKDVLSTFALKFKNASVVEEFCAAVTAYKGKAAAVLKTPENSPKASDD